MSPSLSRFSWFWASFSASPPDGIAGPAWTSGRNRSGQCLCRGVVRTALPFATETDHVAPGGVEVDVGHAPLFAASADDSVLRRSAFEIPDFISVSEAEADTNGHVRSDPTQSERKLSRPPSPVWEPQGPMARRRLPPYTLVTRRKDSLPSTSLTVRLPPWGG